MGDILESTNVNVAGKQEGNLDTKTRLKMMDEYVVHKNDRNSIGGRITILVKRTLKHNVLLILSNFRNIEATMVEVRLNRPEKDILSKLTVQQNTLKRNLTP